MSDFWRFDPSAATPWTQLRDIANTSDDDYDDDYTSIVRSYGVSFVIDGKAYLTLGSTAGGSYYSNYWIYDPETDLWEGDDLTAFEGSMLSVFLPEPGGSLRQAAVDRVHTLMTLGS